jgi:hypothetical protein
MAAYASILQLGGHVLNGRWACPGFPGSFWLGALRPLPGTARRVAACQGDGREWSD